ncbi:MAG: M28 family peptidase [Clostridia bacterium]|nr:M28 family peptidase [Clostridia bacterium]
MTKTQKILTSIFSIFLCALFFFSVLDTVELEQKTNFDRANIMAHIEKLTENGPRSVTNPESNQAALDYMESVLKGYGLVNEDTDGKPAYLIQSYIAQDDKYQSFALKNIIVHIPANAETKSGDAIMFMGHTDSVPMGPGASDDGVACATMLEAIRYYLDRMEDGYTLTNDLLFCFVNGEEYGLYGSTALKEEFKGFNDVLNRVKFLTNLESRGTSGTVIMFETAKNNYETIKLFSEVNQSIFTCSIATLVYDTMPNYTDFTTFKEAYQGLNMANITGGENYHTQNDSFANTGKVYISQQAQIVDGLIEKLSNYELSRLYDAEESAIFFSFLNLTTVVYNQTTVIVLAVLCILLLLGNILLGVFRKQNHFPKTAKAFVGIVAALALSAGAAFICYYLFQWIAVLTGAIDVHMIGTIQYSNTAIVIGIGILSLAMTLIAVHFSVKLLKIERRDLIRAFAYLHAVLGIALSFALPPASYLFIFSGILFTVNELLISAFPKKNIENLHLELLVTALYFPLIIPVIVLATSALGLSMAYVYAIVFTLSVFALAASMLPLCRYLSVRMVSKKIKSVSSAEGAVHILAVSLVIFLCVSFGKPNAAANLQGKQNIVKLPYDDALVYVVDEKGNAEYRIYDLNSVGALKPYSPEMKYVNDEYYVGTGDRKDIALSVLSSAEDDTLNIEKSAKDSLIYLEIQSNGADFFTVSDGNITRSYELTDEVYTIKLHSNCTVTFHGAATVSYKEVVRDYAPLVPAAYANDKEPLHFNLWMTDSFIFE